MKNLKDTITTICAILTGLGLFFAGLNVVSLHLPAWVTAAGVLLAGISNVVSQVLIGKNADGSTKSPEQLQIQQDPKKDIGSGM